MDRKSRAAAAAAAGAVAILVLAGAGRCTAATLEAPGSPEAPARAQQAEGACDDTDDDAAGAETAMTALQTLESRAWVAPGDASKTMTMSGGVITESDGTNTRTTAYEVASESDGKVALTLTRADGSQLAAEVSVSGEGDGAECSCDAFLVSLEWRAVPTHEGLIDVTGVDDAYLALVSDDGTALRLAVGLWAQSHAPLATSASFDGEVFVNTKTGEVTATLTCDDPGQTIASVKWSAGTFAVTG